MVKFSPDGNLVFSGARKDSVIQCWDIRSATEVGGALPLLLKVITMAIIVAMLILNTIPSTTPITHG